MNPFRQELDDAVKTVKETAKGVSEDYIISGRSCHWDKWANFDSFEEITMKKPERGRGLNHIADQSARNASL